MQLHFTSLKASGRLLLLAGVATLALSNVSRAQSCCNNGGDVFYGGAPMVEAYDPAALLDEPIDPAKIINLTVVTPEKSIVIVNGEPTVTKGVTRQYLIRDAVPGKKYKFEIEAVYATPEGAKYAAKETVSIDAGGSKTVVMHLRRVKRDPPPPVVPALLAPPAAK